MFNVGDKVVLKAVQNGWGNCPGSVNELFEDKKYLTVTSVKYDENEEQFVRFNNDNNRAWFSSRFELYVEPVAEEKPTPLTKESIRLGMKVVPFTQKTRDCFSENVRHLDYFTVESIQVLYTDSDTQISLKENTNKSAFFYVWRFYEYVEPVVEEPEVVKSVAVSAKVVSDLVTLYNLLNQKKRNYFYNEVQNLLNSFETDANLMKMASPEFAAIALYKEISNAY